MSDSASPSLESLLSSKSDASSIGSALLGQDDRRSLEGNEAAAPSALPAGWTMRYTADGKPYFVDTIARKTTWLDPRTNRPAVWGTQQLPGARPLTNHKGLINEWSLPLPEGWEMGLSANNVPYFINHKTHTTTWTDPRSVLFRDTSREGHEQRMKIKQLKSANDQLQDQIGLISAQQKQLELEVLQSATPETLALAKMKAMADAQRLLEQQYRDAHSRNRDLTMAMYRQKLTELNGSDPYLSHGLSPQFDSLSTRAKPTSASASASAAGNNHLQAQHSSRSARHPRDDRDFLNDTPPMSPLSHDMRPSSLGLPSPTDDLPVTPTDFSDVLGRMGVTDAHLDSDHAAAHLDAERTKEPLDLHVPLGDLLPYSDAPGSPSMGAFGKALEGGDPLFSAEAFDEYLGSWCV